MKCAEAKSLLSPYLDGAVTGTQMHAVSQHLNACTRCKQEYASLQLTQELLGKIGRRLAPADLSLKLRVAISKEVARSNRPSFPGLLMRLENMLNAFLVPATAGLVSALLVFGFFPKLLTEKIKPSATVIVNMANGGNQIPPNKSPSGVMVVQAPVR